MKTLFSLRTACVGLVLAVAVTPAFAQTTNTTTAPAHTCSSGKHRHHDLGALTAAEQAQLEKAHSEAIAANPALKSQEVSLRQQFEALKADKTTASSDQRKAVHQQARQFRTQLRSAELQFDPTLTSIFAKLDAAKHGHHHAV